MKKSEIQKEAEKLMKNKGVDIVHATSDGQLFLSKTQPNYTETLMPKAKS